MRATLTSAILGFLVPVVVLMALNYWNDPFYYYGIPKDARYSTNERWQNPGLLRHQEYDSVVIGTSRSQNFTPAMFAPAGWRVLKVTAKGSTAAEQLATLALALSVGHTQRVLLELSYLSFEAVPQNGSATFPGFLYEPSLETPFLYLLSFDLLLESSSDFHRSPKALADLNVWWPDYRHQFNEAHFYRSVEGRCRARAPQQRNEPLPQPAAELSRFETLVAAHPQVEFLGYLPPMAAITLTDYGTGRGALRELSHRLSFRRAVAELAGRHGNLTVYDYATQRDIVLDVARYKDPGHYDMSVTERIATELSSASGPLLSGEDPNTELLELREQAYQSTLPCAPPPRRTSPSLPKSPS